MRFKRHLDVINDSRKWFPGVVCDRAIRLMEQIEAAGLPDPKVTPMGARLEQIRIINVEWLQPGALLRICLWEYETRTHVCVNPSGRISPSVEESKVYFDEPPWPEILAKFRWYLGSGASAPPSGLAPEGRTG